MIERNFEAVLIETAGEAVNVSFPMRLSYNPADPLAVQMTFYTGEPGGVVWNVSRELMMKGVVCGWSTGLGDVKFRYEGPTGGVLVCLTSPEGHCHIRMPQDEVVSFLNATQDAIRHGDESCDAEVDEFIKELFA